MNSAELVARLRKAADEMRAEDQNGWPVTCDEAADRFEALEAERDRLRDRLQASIVAIDDWLHQYAGEFCDEKYVAETIQRIRDNGGTLAYIADVQEANRAALQKEPQP